MVSFNDAPNIKEYKIWTYYSLLCVGVPYCHVHQDHHRPLHENREVPARANTHIQNKGIRSWQVCSCLLLSPLWILNEWKIEEEFWKHEKSTKLEKNLAAKRVWRQKVGIDQIGNRYKWNRFQMVSAAKGVCHRGWNENYRKRLLMILMLELWKRKNLFNRKYFYIWDHLGYLTIILN